VRVKLELMALAIPQDTFNGGCTVGGINPWHE